VSGKWLGLLKELAPGLAWVALVRELLLLTESASFAAIQAFASSSSLELTTIDPSNIGKIEPVLKSFGREPNSGVIVAAGPSSAVHRGSLIEAITHIRLPAVHPFSYFALAGGLASYGPDSVEIHISAAESGIGPLETCRRHRAMSEFEGKAENIYSH
jgi:putative tryptophan/tyrosine transport system substrate-binding protein